jgi:hypothetical protein
MQIHHGDTEAPGSKASNSVRGSDLLYIAVVKFDIICSSP